MLPKIGAQSVQLMRNCMCPASRHYMCVAVRPYVLHDAAKRISVAKAFQLGPNHLITRGFNSLDLGNETLKNNSLNMRASQSQQMVQAARLRLELAKVAVFTQPHRHRVQQPGLALPKSSELEVRVTQVRSVRDRVVLGQ